MQDAIEIIIRRGFGQSGAGDGLETATMAPSKDNLGKSSLVKGAVNAALLNGAKSLLQRSVGQFTQFTGNTFFQREFEGYTDVAAMVTQVARNGWAGVVSVGYELTQRAITNQMAVFRSNAQANMLYQRSGNASIDGGRGTHD
jgi:hypothetical protein